MSCRRFDITFGGSAPDGDQARGSRGFSEVADVGTQLLGEIHFVLALFDVGPVNQLYVIVIEDSFAGLDGTEKRLDLIKQVAIKHSSLRGRGVHVIGENVPAGEDEVV